MEIVYAVDTANIMMPDGSMVLIQRGQPWSVNEDVVQFKPELFSTEADRPAPTAIGPDGAPVEQATAAPGERRSTRR